MWNFCCCCCCSCCRCPPPPFAPIRPSIRSSAAGRPTCCLCKRQIEKPVLSAESSGAAGYKKLRRRKCDSRNESKNLQLYAHFEMRRLNCTRVRCKRSPSGSCCLRWHRYHGDARGQKVRTCCCEEPCCYRLDWTGWSRWNLGTRKNQTSWKSRIFFFNPINTKLGQLLLMTNILKLF